MEHTPLLLFLTSTAAMPLRVPVSKPRDLRQQSGSSTATQKSSLDLQRCAPDKPLETLSVVSEDALPPQLVGKPQSHQKENGKKQSEGMEAQEAFPDSCLFRGECIFVGCFGIIWHVCSAIAPLSL